MATGDVSSQIWICNSYRVQLFFEACSQYHSSPLCLVSQMKLSIMVILQNSIDIGMQVQQELVWAIRISFMLPTPGGNQPPCAFAILSELHHPSAEQAFFIFAHCDRTTLHGPYAAKALVQSPTHSHIFTRPMLMRLDT